jgi:hypothetical protein
MQIIKAFFTKKDVLDERLLESSYTCPTCGYKPQEEFYFFIKTTAVYCTKYNKKTKSIYGKIPWYLFIFNKKVYPVYGKSYPKYFGGYDWEETHYCPYCKKEFSFGNGSD